MVSGTPGLSTAATADSASRTHPITITAGTLAADDYGFNLVAGNLTVSQAADTVAVTSNNNTPNMASRSHCSRHGDPGQRQWRNRHRAIPD